MKYPELTLVIPTFNEFGNIAPLMHEIENALVGIEWSVIFVDDNSSDGTIAEIQRIINQDPRVDGVTRIGARGLAGAVLTGLPYTRSSYVAIMDADLQHDPKLLREMLAGLNLSPTKQIAIASRYLKDYEGDGLNKARYFGSRFLTVFSQFFISKKLTDPMSGFFLVRREKFLNLAPQLSPHGYKILLDLVSRIKEKDSIVEYPLKFRARNLGESKMDFRVIWELIMILVYRVPLNAFPRQFISYSMIGLIGLAVHLIVLYLFYQILDTSFSSSQILATLIAMLNNFLLNNYLTYWTISLKGIHMIYGYLKFVVICTFGGFISYVIANYFYTNGSTWFIAGILGAVAAAGWNYSFTKFLTWGRQKPKVIWLQRSL